MWPRLTESGLEASLLLDQLGQSLADAREARVTKGIGLGVAQHLAHLGQMTAFRHHHHAVVLAVIVVVLEQRADVVDVDVFFGNQNDVRTAGHAGGVGDPAGIAAHHLNNDDAIVRVGGRVDAVDVPRWRSLQRCRSQNV